MCETADANERSTFQSREKQMKSKFQIRGESHTATELNNSIRLDGQTIPVEGNGTWQRMIAEVLDCEFAWLDAGERAQIIEDATDE